MPTLLPRPSTALAFALPILLALPAWPAQAGALLDLNVIDRTTGEQLPIYRHQGRLYVAGTPGHRYALTLNSKSGGRLLGVVSVDGVNVLDGQSAATDQSGYVLDPRESAEVAGWRKSMEQVAAFYFTNLADSYAARTDRPQNVGVIGVAVFEEAPPPPPPAWSNQAAEALADRAPAPAASQARREAADSASKLGTGHGERLDAPTRYTEFRRASARPAEVIRIYYDSRSRLVAQGVIPARPRPTPYPDPFPGGFVPDPR